MAFNASTFGNPIAIVFTILGGAALAIAVCGSLALLVNIRDLLEESLRNQT